ncbi:hypothetical protein DAPPUDRAFT_258480 [Daphnia pulex]|uniref:Uncharacterized protein n=1 Tax=Daphnia pulex TaxID=6669 RepID=E9HFG7_DAPPU|nr:hypothetical protein DAPPUDRAFT_258480 [Daphnia pulex]|eukprot:EFX69527.1 hypothetical protein DAPPUDRAFT_258480 [Daphnia pulex]
MDALKVQLLFQVVVKKSTYKFYLVSPSPSLQAKLSVYHFGLGNVDSPGSITTLPYDTTPNYSTTTGSVTFEADCTPYVSVSCPLVSCQSIDNQLPLREFSSVESSPRCTKFVAFCSFSPDMSRILEFKQSKSTSWESKSSKHEVEMASDLNLDLDADADLENSFGMFLENNEVSSSNRQFDGFKQQQLDDVYHIWRVSIGGEERREANIPDNGPIPPIVISRVATASPILLLCLDRFKIFKEAKLARGVKSATKEPTTIATTRQQPYSGNAILPDFLPNPPWEQTVDMEAQPADVVANIDQLNLQSTPMVSSPSQVPFPVPFPSVIRQHLK